MPSRRLIQWIFIELLVIGCIAGYFLLDAAIVYRWWVGTTDFVVANAECNLNKETCSAHLKDGSILNLEIFPKPIPLMKPLHFKVTSSIDLPSIEIKLFATNMNMGLHTVKLKATSKGIYEAEGLLPSCIVGNMIWQANVIVDQPTRSLGASFTFQTTQ